VKTKDMGMKVEHDICFHDCPDEKIICRSKKYNGKGLSCFTISPGVSYLHYSG
jgi:hypothetical protein